MTQDEIIELARQAGFDVKEWGDETLIRTVHSKGYFVVINQKLEAFAKLVAEKEREACAKVCDDELKEWGIFDSDVGDVSKAIRARGQV
jgi:hypothetical protein